MAKIKFENGMIVNFSGNPTPEDVEEVAKKLGISARTTRASAPTRSQMTAGQRVAGAVPFVGEAVGQTVRQIGGGILGGAKRTGSTLSGLASIGQRGLESTIGAGLRKFGIGPEPTKKTAGEIARERFFTPEGSAQKGGFGAMGLAEFLLPSTKVAKFEKGLRLPQKALIEAGTFGGITAAQTGEIGEEAKSAAFLGGALPVAGAIVKNLPYTQAASLLTNVNKDVLKRVYKNPQKTEVAEQIIKENPSNPFLPLAEKVSSSIARVKENAKTNWEEASNVFREKYGEATFNFADKIPKLKSPLEEFGLTLKQGREAGKLTSEFLVKPKGKITAFEQNEIKNIQKIVDDLRNADGFTVDDIFAFREKFDTLYNAVKLNLDGSPKKYHALITNLQKDSDKFISKVLPDELKAADKMYQQYYNLYKDVGSKIAGPKGEVKKGAESFLSTITNKNKGEIRKLAGKYKNEIGDIVDDVQSVADAKKISEFFATTGSRTQDIIRSFLISGVRSGLGAGAGFLTGGPVGAGIVGSLTSPKIVGGITKGLGKIRQVAPKEKPAVGTGLRGAISERIFGGKK